MAPSNSINPAIQAILEKKRLEEAQLMEGLRKVQEGDARLERAITAWLRVACFLGDAIPRGLHGQALQRRYAELIVELGQVLRSDGWQADIDAVAPGNDFKTIALETLRLAMSGDIDAVLALMEASDEAFFRLGLGADHWLRYKLMCEVLHIEPPPEIQDRIISPPSGVPFRPEILDDLRSASTPSELRETCQELRRLLAPDNGDRDTTTFRAPDLIRELWTAMRRMGGEVPPSPDLLLRFNSRGDQAKLFAALLKGQLHTVLHPEEVLRAVDDVAAWCVRRGAGLGTEGREGGGRPKGKSGRGRPSDTDSEADKRISDAWDSGAHKTEADLARELRIPEREVSLARERHRKRLKRAEEKRRTNSTDK
jgi:hypothetical protein